MIQLAGRSDRSVFPEIRPDARNPPHPLRNSVFDLSELPDRIRRISNCNRAESPFHGNFTDAGARKCDMTGLLIGAAVWMVIATIVATVLGRVARRGDSEELGSTIEWDVDALDHEVHHEN